MGLGRFPHRFMVYQPVVDLASGGVIFYEALFRSGSSEATQAVCLAAEREGWIIELDLYALRSAQQVLREHPLISLAVNLSAASIAACADVILRLLDQDRTSCPRLYLEITESCDIGLAALLAFADSCRERQIKMVQDDFGIDFSTVARARALRPAWLKLVAPTRTGQLQPWAQTSLRIAAALAQEIGAGLLVERIETRCAQQLAMRYGARAGQGYAYGKPASLPRLTPGNAAALIA